jgi:hypothetical protein
VDHPSGHQHPDGQTCPDCLVDPRRNKSSLIAWIVAAVAVAFAILVYVSRAGSAGFNLGAYGALGIVMILACPLMMGAMMWMMMRHGGKHQ